MQSITQSCSDSDVRFRDAYLYITPSPENFQYSYTILVVEAGVPITQTPANQELAWVDWRQKNYAPELWLIFHVISRLDKLIYS